MCWREYITKRPWRVDRPGAAAPALADGPRKSFASLRTPANPKRPPAADQNEKPAAAVRYMRLQGVRALGRSNAPVQTLLFKPTKPKRVKA